MPLVHFFIPLTTSYLPFLSLFLYRFPLLPVFFSFLLVLHEGCPLLSTRWWSFWIDLRVCRTVNNDCVWWGVREEHIKRKRDRDWRLPGSEFSKGLLAVFVCCQKTVNGALISFKRLSGLIEKPTGSFIYMTRWQSRNKGKERGHKFKFRGKQIQQCYLILKWDNPERKLLHFISVNPQWPSTVFVATWTLFFLFAFYVFQ